MCHILKAKGETVLTLKSGKVDDIDCAVYILIYSRSTVCQGLDFNINISPAYLPLVIGAIASVQSFFITVFAARYNNFHHLAVSYSAVRLCNVQAEAIRCLCRCRGNLPVMATSDDTMGSNF